MNSKKTCRGANCSRQKVRGRLPAFAFDHIKTLFSLCIMFALENAFKCNNKTVFLHHSPHAQEKVLLRKPLKDLCKANQQI